MSQDTDNTYIIKTSNPGEFARLQQQDHLLNQHMLMLPEGFVVKRGARILDLACGTGQWAMNVAKKHPVHVTWIDIDPLMITWAKSQVHDPKRVEFQLGNILKTLPFKDGTFDLINSRLLLAAMTNDLWVPLIKECFRVSKPGGMICMSETNGTSSPTLNQRLDRLVHKAYFHAKKGFCEDDYGVCAFLGLFLMQGGYKVVDSKAYVLDQSYETELHNILTQDFTVFIQLIKPFLQRYLSEDDTQDLDNLCEEVSQGMLSPNYRALWWITSVIGKKPLTSLG